jgi:hypothetical protein
MSTTGVAASDKAFEEFWEYAEARYLLGYQGYPKLSEADKTYAREVAKSFWLQGRLYQLERSRV